MAPPRWKGDGPREPSGLLGKTGIVIGFSHDDAHEWGGIWDLIVNGKPTQYYGDFMEVISEGR